MIHESTATAPNDPNAPTDLINVFRLVKSARQKDARHRWAFLGEDDQIFANTH